MYWYDNCSVSGKICVMLLTTGCSVVYGAELDEKNWYSEEHWEKTFSHHLSKHLGVDYTCLAKCGNSNHKIFRDLMQWFIDDNVSSTSFDQNTRLSNCTHMVVLWSHVDRDEFFSFKNLGIEKVEQRLTDSSDMCLRQYQKNGLNVHEILTENQRKTLDDFNKEFRNFELDMIRTCVYMQTIQMLCENHNIKLIQGFMDDSPYLKLLKSFKKNEGEPKRKIYYSRLKKNMNRMLKTLKKNSRIGLGRPYPRSFYSILGDDDILKYGHPNSEKHKEYARYLYRIFQED